MKWLIISCGYLHEFISSFLIIGLILISKSFVSRLIWLCLRYLRFEIPVRLFWLAMDLRTIVFVLLISLQSRTIKSFFGTEKLMIEPSRQTALMNLFRNLVLTGDLHDSDHSGGKHNADYHSIVEISNIASFLALYSQTIPGMKRYLTLML